MPCLFFLNQEDMIVKRRVCFFVVMISAIVFLSACEEGKPLNLSEKEKKTEDADMSKDKYSSDDELFQQDSLQVQYQGGTYHVDSWKLYDNLAEANISIDSLSDYGVMLSETGKDFKFMLVTISRTSTADYEGDFPDQVYVNIFYPVTLKNMSAAYLPVAEPDMVSHIYMEHGYEPVYLDIGETGASNYFEISTPSEGESVTYSLGFFLSEEEYQAGENGELYLWYSMDEAQSVEDLQLLFLSPKSLS